MKSKYLLFIVLIICVLIAACSKKSPNDPGDQTVFDPGIVDTQLEPGLKDVLNFNQLTVLSPDGAIGVNSQGEFKADFSLGAAESLETAVVPVVQDGVPVLLSYYFNEKDFNPFGKTTAIGTQTTALALIMMNPLWMTADQQIKKEVAQKAVKHAQFNTLASQIEQALRSQPTVYLGAGGADLTLYTTAAQISLDIYKDYVSESLQKVSGANEVTDRPDPYYEDGSGQKVYVYNPFYIFYGVGFFDYANNSLKKNHLMSPRPLKWGLIPYVGDYGKSEQTLTDGNYSIVFYKGFKGTDGHTFDFSHPAGLATGINVCAGAVNILSIILDFGDLTGVWGEIPDLLSRGRLVFDAISLRDDFADQDAAGQIGVLIVFIGSNIDEIVKWHISVMVNAGDAKGFAVNYFKAILPALKNISLPLKVLGAATKVPFFVDIFAAPSRVQYNVSSTAGVLQPITTPANTPPTASFTVTPSSGTTSTDFQFNASGCSDAQDAASVLQVRWDFENNGAWTDYTAAKTATHRYTTTGTKTIKLEVKDSGGLLGTTTRQVTVSAQQTNTPPTASFTVTPSSGTTSTDFQFNASGCSDAQDASSALQVRWDWENNGTWTNYTTSKTATHRYSTTGTKTIKLEVKDSSGLPGTATRQVTVSEGSGGDTGTVTDIDGNVYRTIKIGNQWWMAENLKVTKYCNGDDIRNITDATEWANLTSGAYCNYDNNISNVATYGRLYSWYAVTDNRNIAPIGWHVPTDAEWQVLVDFLGGNSVAGGKMKATSTSQWRSPNSGATNESGFSALPGGWRDTIGYFTSLGSYAIFWSSTESSRNYVWNRDLHYGHSDVTRDEDPKEGGYSVRCVRDDTPGNTSPTASFTVSPSGGTTSTDFQFDASGCSDAQDASSTLQMHWDWENNGTWTNYTTSKTATHRYSTTGTKTIKLEVKDNGGLIGTTTRQVMVTASNTAPTASFTVSPSGGTTSTDFSFNASGCSDAQDASSALQVRWDWENNGTWTNFTTSKTATHRYSTSGTKTIKLEVKDTGGLIGTTTRQVTVTASNTAPTASFTVSPAGGTTSTDFQFDASGCSDQQDASSTLQVRWDWENNGTWTNYTAAKTATHRYSTTGTKTIKLEVKDGGGLIGTTTRQVTVTASNTAPTASFTVSPSGGTTSTDFQFDASGCSDAQDASSALQVRWDWENNGTWTNYTAAKTATHRYTTTGTKTVKLEVKDTGGLIGTTTRQVTVTAANTAPTASFTVSPSAGTTTTDFQFDASGCSDAQDASSALQVRWDWENNGSWTNPTTNKTATHRYTTTGTKTIKLEVKDSGGLPGTATRQVTVSEDSGGTIELQWVAVNGGTFDMGDTWGDGSSDEQPVHQVTLSSFQMSKYEVTNAQYAKFLNDYGSDKVKSGEFAGKTMAFEYEKGVQKSGTTWQPAPGYDNFPIVYVKWYGAFEFCRYYGFRMPTEAEWEYAARGGSKSKGYKYSGSDNADAAAWYDANSSGQTHQVGTKASNELGLYDMSGNVWEWCGDWYDSGYYAVSPQNNPQGPVAGNYRVLRGGSWYDGDLRVCDRGSYNPDGYASITFGFRCVR